MKMTDNTVQDDCCIEIVTPKKKKMKQAQLPFQMLSSLEAPNGISSKKRKLRSPAVEYKSPKVVKIAKESLHKDVQGEELSSNTSSTLTAINESIQVEEDTESKAPVQPVQCDQTEIAMAVGTPKRDTSGKSKKLKNSKRTSSSLSKFITKSKQEAEIPIEDKENSTLQEDEADVSTDKDSSAKYSKAVSPLMNTQAEEANTSVENDSLSSSFESDIEILSSECEDKDEQEKSSEKLQKISNTESLNTPKKTPKTDKNTDTIQNRKLTPKQQEKLLRSAKKREERERLRMEKEKKLEEERENRRKEKEKIRKEKEEKDKAEKEQRMQEIQQKKLRKQIEIQQKQKEKEAKEEERRKKEEAREEEKRKKEEEKLEAERKKQKAASNFASFFVPKKQETKSTEEENVVAVKNFMPFEVKADMKVAPICRRVLSEQEKLLLDEKCKVGRTKTSELYLNEIINKKITPRKSTKTWPLEAKDDVILLDEENEGTSNIVDQNVPVEKQKPKLLQFNENRRPPYWGTWRKRSYSINPRRPFATDTKWFNYEVESDEEWEEEEPGESLRGSDDEKDEESPEDNEYDVDNEFMVPHGYLSDEEARADEEDKEDMTPETQKFKLKVLGEQFESERNTKTSKLKPKIIGCIWQGPGNTYSENVPPRTINFLSAHQAWVRQIPVVLSTSSENDATVGECSTPTKQQAQTTSKKTKVPAEALPDLIRLVHGNTHGRSFLVREFMTYWNKRNKVGENPISKASLLQKIREIGAWMACPEEGPMHLKACWYVAEEKRKEHLLEELTLPNRWSYVLTPKRKSEFPEVAERVEREEKDKEKKSVPLITQFTKKITQEEMKKQLAVKPNNSTPSKIQQKAPKRATLISVGIGEQFLKTTRDSLLKNAASTEKMEKTDSSPKTDDPVVVVVSDSEENNQTNDQVASKTKSNEAIENADSFATRLSIGDKSKRKSKSKSIKDKTDDNCSPLQKKTKSDDKIL